MQINSKGLFTSVFWWIGKNVQNEKTEQKQSFARFWLPEGVRGYVERRRFFVTKMALI